MMANITSTLRANRNATNSCAAPVYGRTFLLLMLLALSLRLATAVYLPNLSTPDEIYQTTEPAHRLVFGCGVVAWEWRDGARSWALPALLAGVMRLTAWMGTGSYGYTLGIAAALSCFSLVAVWFAYVWGWRVLGPKAAVLCGFMAAVWYQLVYFGPKPMNEAVSTHLFLAGIYLGLFAFDAPRPRRWLFAAGILSGTAFALRVQLGPVVALLAALSCWRRSRRDWGAILAGLAVSVLSLGLLDSLTWTSPFQSTVRYVLINAVQGKSSTYGTEPWFWYFSLLIFTAAPLLYFAVIGRSVGMRLLVIALAVIVTHSAFAHKEPRLIYPAIPLLAAAAGAGLWILLKTLHHRFERQMSLVPLMAGAMILMAGLSAALALGWNWRQSRGKLLALRYLSTQADVCGVGVDAHWAFSGGYTYLHQCVPIYPLDAGDHLMHEITPTTAFNYAVLDDALPANFFGFTKQRCWSQTCLYQRSGACVVDPALEINEVLVKIRQ